MPDRRLDSGPFAKQLLFLFPLVACVFRFWRIGNQYFCPAYLFLAAVSPVPG